METSLGRFFAIFPISDSIKLSIWAVYHLNNNDTTFFFTCCSNPAASSSPLLSPGTVTVRISAPSHGLLHTPGVGVRVLLTKICIPLLWSQAQSHHP